MDEYLTKKALAERLGISVRTINRRLKENPGVATLNDGRIIRFRLEDYIRACNERRANA